MIIINERNRPEAAKDVLSSRWGNDKYTILDMKHVGYGADVIRFNLSIELLNLTYFFKRVERMFRGMGVERNIDISILYEAIDHVFKDKPFSNAQLIRYYELAIEFEKVVDSMTSLLKEDDHYVSYDIDFILLGATIEEIEAAENCDKKTIADVHEKYGDNVWEMKKGEISVKELITISQKQIKAAFKEIEQEHV